MKHFLIALAAILPLGVQAIPARPGVTILESADGAPRTVLIQGDENGYTLTDPSTRRILKKKQAPPSAAPLRIAGSTNNFPAHGKQRAIAVLVDFPASESEPEGRRFSIENPRQHFENLLNAPGFSTDGATGSVRDFFLASSGGVLDLTFDVYGPVTMSRDALYYATKTNGQDLNAWQMAREALQALDADVDFSLYDRDSDGIIDNVYVFYAGQGAATGGDPEKCIWQHAADVERISKQQFLFDGLRLNHYACSNEMRTTPDRKVITEGIGTVVHEFSHVLGLPDLYDTAAGTVYTPGVWSTMDTGCHLNDSRTPPLFSAFEKQSLGWCEPLLLDSQPATISLRPSSSGDAAMIASHDPDEYFILENRQQEGWDAFLPAHGMLVWHIVYSPDYWQYNQVNTRPERPGVTLVEADGIASPGSVSDDTFPGAAGVTTLTDEGYPNLRTHNGAPCGITLSDIRENAGIISLEANRMVSSLPQIQGVELLDLTPTSATLKWEEVQAYGVTYIIEACAESGTITRTVRHSPYTLTGLQPATTYTYTIRAKAGDVTGEPSHVLAFLTPEESFVFTRPSTPVAHEVTADGFTLSWEPLEDAESYEVALFTKTPVAAATDLIDFSTPLNALPGGWTTDARFTLSMDGYYGEASPALSLTDDGQTLISPDLGGDITSLSLWLRERSGAGEGALQISMLSDGRWKQVALLPLPEKMKGQSFTLSPEEIPAEARSVSLTYMRGAKGSLALDDVKATYATSYSTTPLQGWEALPATSNSVKVSGLPADLPRLYANVCGIHADGSRSRPSSDVRIDLGSNSLGTLPAAQNLKPVLTAQGTVLLNGEPIKAQVFDLTGRRISHPSPGIYLIKTPDTTYKIAF